MMTNALFLSSRWLDGATVAASSVQGSLVANNVQTIRPDEVWRATGCAAEYLTFDFGADVVANSAAVIGHNGTAAITFRLRLGTSAANVTAAPGIDTGAVSGWPASGKHDDPDWPYEFSLLTWSSSTGYRYGRLDIADAANPDGYVQIGRLLAGPAFVPAMNIDLTPSLGLLSPDEVGRTAFGVPYGDSRGPAARTLSLPMSSLGEDDDMGEGLFELQRYCGLARDFAFCLDPAATTRFHRYSLQARFPSLAAFQAQPFWNDDEQLWQTTLPLEEIT